MQQILVSCFRSYLWILHGQRTLRTLQVTVVTSRVVLFVPPREQHLFDWKKAKILISLQWSQQNDYLRSLTGLMALSSDSTYTCRDVPLKYLFAIVHVYT